MKLIALFDENQKTIFEGIGINDDRVVVSEDSNNPITCVQDDYILEILCSHPEAAYYAEIDTVSFKFAYGYNDTVLELTAKDGDDVNKIIEHKIREYQELPTTPENIKLVSMPNSNRIQQTVRVTQFHVSKMIKITTDEIINMIKRLTENSSYIHNTLGVYRWAFYHQHYNELLRKIPNSLSLRLNNKYITRVIKLHRKSNDVIRRCVTGILEEYNIRECDLAIQKALFDVVIQCGTIDTFQLMIRKLDMLSLMNQFNCIKIICSYHKIDFLEVLWNTFSLSTIVVVKELIKCNDINILKSTIDALHINMIDVCERESKTIIKKLATTNQDIIDFVYPMLPHTTNNIDYSKAIQRGIKKGSFAFAKKCIENNSTGGLSIKHILRNAFNYAAKSGIWNTSLVSVSFENENTFDLVINKLKNTNVFQFVSWVLDNDEKVKKNFLNKNLIHFYKTDNVIGIITFIYYSKDMEWFDAKLHYIFSYLASVNAVNSLKTLLCMYDINDFLKDIISGAQISKNKGEILSIVLNHLK